MGRAPAVVLALGCLAATAACKRQKPLLFSRVWLGVELACGQPIGGGDDHVCWGAGADARRMPALAAAREVVFDGATACGLVASGEVRCDGPDAPPARRARAVAFAKGRRCAVLDEPGVVVACDARDFGREGASRHVVHGGGEVVALAASTTQVCVATTSGVSCFGEGGERRTPLEGAPVARVTSLAVGRAHACALSEDGTVRCWGENAEGELGDGTNGRSDRAVTVTGLEGVVEIAAGDRHTCARLRNDTVSCWGANDQSQLADGSTTSRARPAAVHALVGAAEIAAAGDGTCARRHDGELRCWGANTAGQLGVPRSFGATLNVPTPFRYRTPPR